MGEIEISGAAAERLKVVNEAIYAVLKGGQSYRIGTRELQRADLRELLKMQKRLTAEVTAVGDSPLLPDCVVGVFDGR